MAARANSDRRRKRSGVPSGEESSRGAGESIPKRVLPLLVLGLFLLSVLTTSDEANDKQELMHRRFLMNENDGEGGGGGGQLLRYLMNENEEGGVDRVMDLGMEENVWRRQLRGRKAKEQRAAGRRADNKARRRDDNYQQRLLEAGMGRWDEDGMERPTRRMAVIDRYKDKHHFHECVGKTIDQCQELVDAYVTAHPDDFNHQTTLRLDLRKIREITDDSYYKVVLRTNMAGNQVYGIFDDGMVYYPWPWRVGGVDTDVGPWSCETDANGVFMNPSECCAVIQADVTAMDDNGNFMACFVEEPVGGPNNPERDDRAIVVTNGKGMVLRSPIAH